MGPRYALSGLTLDSDSVLDGVARADGETQPGWRLRWLPSRRIESSRVRLLRRPGVPISVMWPEVGAFEIIPRTRTLRCRPAPGAGREMLLSVLLGPVLSHLLLLEGSFPIHASAVEIGGCAAAFFGPPGAGKSTVAAALFLAGHPVITEDLLAVTWHRDEPYAHPSVPEIRLWPGSGRRLLGGAFHRLPRVVPTASKRRIDPAAGWGRFSSRPAPLGRLYELVPARVRRPSIEPLGARDAWRALMRNRYNLWPQSVETQARQLDALARLAGAAPGRRLIVPRAMRDPAHLVPLIRRDLRAGHDD
ncbi:MAG TPA: hypothetical protein VGB20_06625 [bacterium]